MAKFPITRAPERLGVTPTTAVRVGLDVSAVIPPDVVPTGVGAIGGAIAGIGRAISGLGLAFRKAELRRQQDADLIEADTQLSEATREANRISNEINDLVRAAPDTSEETYNKINADITARIQALRPKNEKAARAFDRKMSALIPKNEELIANARLNEIETSFLAEEQALLNEVRLGEGLGDYLIHLQKGKKLGITGRKTDEQLRPLQQAGRAIATQAAIVAALNGDDLIKAEALLLQSEFLTPQQVSSLKGAIKAGQKVIEQKAIEEAKEVLLSKIQGLPPEDAFEIIDADKTIPFDQKKAVRQEWSVRDGILKQQQAEERIAFQATTRNNFLGKIRSDEDKTELKGEIDVARAAGTLTAEAHVALSNLLKKPDIINQSDPQTELEISTRVRVRPETITSDEIMGLVGKGKDGGLSLAKAESLADKWQTWKDSTEKKEKVKDPKISSFAKRGHSVINELEGLGKRYGLKGAKKEKDWKTTEDVAQFYNILNEYHDALDAFMDTNPTPPQVREFVDNLLIAEKQVQAESSIIRWWRAHMPEYIGGPALFYSFYPTQFDRPKTEREFKAQVKSIEDEDEARAYYDLWKDDFK